jgi:hypothetical protein
MPVSIRLPAMVLAPGVVAGTWRQEAAGVVKPLPDPQPAPGLDNLTVSGPPALRLRPGSLTPVTSGAARAD